MGIIYRAGTYGPHGCETGYISIRREPIPLNEFFGALETSAGLEPTGNEESADRTFRRTIEYVKLTGDINVPSGEPSWQAFLPDDERDVLPTVTNAAWLDWSNASATAIDPSVWGRGTARARGRGQWSDAYILSTWAETFCSSVALQGYNQARWSVAETLFIRNEDSKQVDEIRLRWIELRKVAIIRRIIT